VTRLALALVLATASVDEPPAAVDDQDPAVIFRSATDALAGDRSTDAIAKFEALGDHGVVDPVASFDRGLAYAKRVRAGAEQSGDLGRAVHGFEEARELSRDPALVADASRALVAIRAEIARRRARAGDPVEIEQGLSLGRSIVGLLPENVWTAIAIACSAILSIALVIRARVGGQRAKVAATTTAAISGALLGVTALLAVSAREVRVNLREAIVVTPNVRLLDAAHLARDGMAPIPEGARVRIVDELGGYAHVAVGSEDGWLSSSAVLPLAKAL